MCSHVLLILSHCVFFTLKKKQICIIYEINWYAIGEVKYFLGQTTWVLNLMLLAKYIYWNTVLYTIKIVSFLQYIPIIQSCSKSYPLIFPQSISILDGSYIERRTNVVVVVVVVLQITCIRCSLAHVVFVTLYMNISMGQASTI